MTQPAIGGEGVDDVTKVDLSKIKVMKYINRGFVWDIFEINHEVTRKMAREERVLMIDLTWELPKSSKYYYDLIHYDHVGDAEVGDIAYRYLYSYLAE